MFTRMQRLSYGFSQFYEEISPKGTVIITYEFDLYTLYMFHSKFMVAFAKMLMHCEKFSSLDNKDKVKNFDIVTPPGGVTIFCANATCANVHAQKHLCKSECANAPAQMYMRKCRCAMFHAQM
jgi:hypothetical protein